MNVREDVLKIQQREEEQYYPKLKELIDNSVLYPKDKEGKKRLKEELDFIHNILSSRTIVFLYMVVQEAKKNNEPYIIGDSFADLYVLYVLGITKIDPTKIHCSYQTCLGTKTHTGSKILFNISFRKGFLDIIKQFTVKMIPNTTCYYYTFFIDEETVDYSPYSVLMVSNDFDLKKYCDIKDFGDDLLVVGLKEDDGFEAGVLFNFFDDQLLSIVKDMSEKYPLVSIDEGIEDFKQVLDDPEFTSDFCMEMSKVMPLNEFEDYLDLEGYACGKRAIKDDLSSYVFPDREAVYYYLSQVVGMPEDLAMGLTSKVRTGKFRKMFFDDERFEHFIGKPQLADLYNILYLPCRGKNAERLYWKLQAAHYCIKHKEEYLFVCKKYDDDNVIK